MFSPRPYREPSVVAIDKLIINLCKIDASQSGAGWSLEELLDAALEIRAMKSCSEPNARFLTSLAAWLSRLTQTPWVNYSSTDQNSPAPFHRDISRNCRGREIEYQAMVGYDSYRLALSSSGFGIVDLRSQPGDTLAFFAGSRELKVLRRVDTTISKSLELTRHVTQALGSFDVVASPVNYGRATGHWPTVEMKLWPLEDLEASKKAALAENTIAHCKIVGGCGAFWHFYASWAFSRDSFRIFALQ
ncbi:hypothetical protein B0T19DRAFT_416424 [Cercophora scortea]|uniref:Uncharacterized protein n=1 Tax=Cercophora scortea TaxID=314031 RepID=A0AAE0IWV4_9PEZI|nr:hypothetical protein B0T19DRAFT_416424 [Cercophora scortea]